MESSAENDNHVDPESLRTVHFVDHSDDSLLTLSTELVDVDTMVALACAQRDRDPNDYVVEEKHGRIELTLKHTKEKQENHYIVPELVVLSEDRKVLLNKTFVGVNRMASYDETTFGEIKVLVCESLDIHTPSMYMLVDDDTGERYRNEWAIPQLFGDRTVVRLACRKGLSDEQLPPIKALYQTNAARIMKTSWDSTLALTQSARAYHTKVKETPAATIKVTAGGSALDKEIKSLSSLASELQYEAMDYIRRCPGLVLYEDDLTLRLLRDIRELMTQTAQRGLYKLALDWPTSQTLVMAQDGTGVSLAWMTLLNYAQCIQDSRDRDALLSRMRIARNVCFYTLKSKSDVDIRVADGETEANSGKWILSWGLNADPNLV